MKINSKDSKNKTKEKRMVEDLRDMKEILDKHNIKYWLDWGTLLGAVRGGEIIEGDKDIDIGMMESDYGKIISILPEIKKKGFLVHKTPLQIPKPSFEKSKYKIDIWPYFQLDKNNFVTYNYVVLLKGLVAKVLWFIWLPFICAEKNINLELPHNKFEFMPHSKFKFTIAFLMEYFLSLFPYKLRKSLAETALKKLIKNDCVEFVKAIVPKYYFEKFRKIKFYGLTFDIPFNAEAYLEYKYGKDWKIPRRKKWVWYKEDGAIIKARGKL